MALKEYRSLGFPTATAPFRAKSWRAFEFALDPLAEARSLPMRRYARDDAGFLALRVALARA